MRRTQRARRALEYRLHSPPVALAYSGDGSPVRLPGMRVSVLPNSLYYSRPLALVACLAAPVRRPSHAHRSPRRIQGANHACSGLAERAVAFQFCSCHLSIPTRSKFRQLCSGQGSSAHQSETCRQLVGNWSVKVLRQLAWFPGIDDTYLVTLSLSPALARADWRGLPALQIRTIRNQGDVATGGAVAAETLVEAASASSPMRLLCEDVRRKSRESASSTPIQFRGQSVVIRCTLPLPLRAAYGAVPLGYVMATPGHFLLNRSFHVHHSRLTPAAPAALRCPWIGDEAAHARRLPAPEFERANTPRRQRHAK